MTERIIESLSHERFETYLRAVGHDPQRALELYVWNLQLAGSFYPLLAGVEVCLRNRVVARLESAFGPEWRTSAEFSGHLGPKGTAILNKAVKKLRARTGQITAGRVTAELSFGFWRNMLLPKYEAPLWTPINAHFAHLPDHVDRGLLETRCETVRDLRNRISHHEPLLKRDITRDYSQALELLRWMSPAKAEWLKPRLETMKLVRQRP